MALERRRILFLHPSADLYGPGRALLDLVSGLPSERYEVLVVLSDRGPLSEELQHRGISVCFRKLAAAPLESLNGLGWVRLAFRLPWAAWQIRQLVRQFEADIVHTNTLSAVGGALGAAWSPAKHLWHVHEHPTQPQLARRAARWLHTLADQVVCNSHATAHAYLRHHRDLLRKTTVVHNGVDATRLQTHLTKTQARAVLGWPSEAPIALVLGRINGWKGQDLALEALGKLHADHPTLHLAIVGSPPDGQEHWQARLEALRESSGLAHRVLLCPFDERVERFYAACDFVIVPSRQPEPFGLVALEAFAAGKPVLAAGHGGPLEIMQRGEVGDLFAPNHAEDLAGKVRAWLANPEDVEHMGAAAVAHQRRRFALRSYHQRFERLYRLLPIRALGENRASGLHDWPQVIHVVLGSANATAGDRIHRFVHELASAQSEDVPIECWYLVHDPDPSPPVRAYHPRTFPRTRWRARLAAGVLARLDLIQNSRAVFHLHGALAREWALLGRELQSRGIPFVVTPHGAYAPSAWRGSFWSGRLWRKRWVDRFALRAWLRGAQAIQALSSDEADHLRARHPNANVVGIPAGRINLDPAEHADGTNPPTPRSRGRRLRIGFWGSLAAQAQDLDRLLEGFALALEEGLHARLVLAGTGLNRARWEEHADRLGVAEHVVWFGAFEGLPTRDFMEQIDLFVELAPEGAHQPMHSESALEAAARGCPLLVSADSNLGQMVERHGAGWVLLGIKPGIDRRGHHLGLPSVR